MITVCLASSLRTILRSNFSSIGRHSEFVKQSRGFNGFWIAVLLALSTQVTANSTSIPATTPAPIENTCISFDNIAMQFSLVQPGMQPPVNLEQLKIILGNKKPETTSIITNYVWIYKNRMLSVTAVNNNLTNKLLTGNDDGSEASRKIQQIYANLKTATSIWIIQTINSQFGQGITSTTKLYTYTWRCGNGTMQINTDGDSNIKSAEIIYTTNEDPITIDSQVGGIGHIPWDIIIDSAKQHQRGWKRTFTKSCL